MRKRAKKLPNDYPRICLRIDASLLAEVDAMRGETGFSYGQIVSQSLRRYLPDLRKFHVTEAREKAA